MERFCDITFFKEITNSVYYAKKRLCGLLTYTCTSFVTSELI